MISNTKPNKTVYDILPRASKKASSLTPEKIKIVLINSLREYQKNEITLHTLSKIAGSLNKEESISSSKSLKAILDEISSFSIIDNVLREFLSELLQKGKE